MLILLNVSIEPSNVILADYLLVSMVSQKKCTIEVPFKFPFIRVSILVLLNSYIAIFSTTKYQNVPYNGGVKTIFFGFTVTMHSLCTVAKILRKKKKKFIYAFTLLLIILLIFILSSILIFLLLRSNCYCCAYTLLLLLYIYIYIYIYLFIQHSHCYILFVCSHCYCSRYIILL